MEGSMLIWKDATQSKPKQDHRVLLKIANHKFPVVGYWGKCTWEGCVYNFKVEPDAYAPFGAEILDAFGTEDVTHYAEIGDLPE